MMMMEQRRDGEGARGTVHFQEATMGAANEVTVMRKQGAQLTFKSQMK